MERAEVDVDLNQLTAAAHHAARADRVRVEVRYMVPDDQQRLLPRRMRAPEPLPAGVPLPQIGHVIYLSSTSAWGVEMVVHEWRSPLDLNIEVWITHVGSARHRRPPGFTLTQ